LLFPVRPPRGKAAVRQNALGRAPYFPSFGSFPGMGPQGPGPETYEHRPIPKAWQRFLCFLGFPGSRGGACSSGPARRARNPGGPSPGNDVIIFALKFVTTLRIGDPSVSSYFAGLLHNLPAHREKHHPRNFFVIGRSPRSHKICSKILKREPSFLGCFDRPATKVSDHPRDRPSPPLARRGISAFGRSGGT